MKLVSTISPGLAEEYGLRTYSKGDCVLFQNEYYRCIADETEPVFPMDETKWEKVDFSVEVTGLKTGLTAEATVREEGDKANATAIKANSDAISALTTAVADEVKTRTEEDAKRPTKDEAILVGENKNKDFSLDGDYSASQGYLTDTAVNASVANIKYFFIPPEPLTSCGIVQVKVYGGLEADITYKDPVLFVLWSYSGSGAFSDDTCKYLGFSDNTVTLAELTAATCTFTSNPYGLQITAGQGLIVQGVPADVTPDNTWKWSEKADLYTVLALACHSEPDSSVFEDWIVATDEGEANKVRFGGMLGVFLKNSVVFSAKNGGIDVANGTGMTVEDVDKTYKTNAKGIGTIILDSAKSYADTQDTTVLSEAKTYTDTANAKAVQKGDNYADDTAAVPSFTLNSEKQGVEGSGTHVSVSPTTYFSGSVREDSTKPTLSTVDTVYKVEAVESTGVSNESGIGTIILNEAKAYADTVSQKVLRYMGSVATIAELPADAKQGDMYNVTETGANYAWTGEEWDKLSETVDLSGLVTKTTEVNGKEIQSGLTLYGTDIKAKEGSDATIQEAALDDAISAIKKYGEETYAFGDGTTPDEFPACFYFVLSSSKITDSTISSISVTAVSYSSPIRLVLWTWEKVGHVENPPKFLGYSSDSHSQVSGEVATWSFDDISLPKGAGLVVQGVPDGETIDDSWTWDEKGYAYDVLSVEAVEVEDTGCIVVAGGKYHAGFEAHCSITAVPRSGQAVGSLAADVASLTTTVANKANTADVIVRGTNYENPSISLYSDKKEMMGGVSSSFSVRGVQVMTTSGPGTSTIEDVDSAYRAGTISDIRGIGSLIKESTLSDIETAATHTYTFGTNGSTGDKFEKTRYAILSPLLLPYGTIKSVAMMASDNVSVTGAKYMLLWAHDGSGSYSSSTCTFLGKSVEAVEQTASTLSTWRFEDVTLPQDHGLIIHLVPEDAAPTGDAWEWDADRGRFEVASCKCQHGVYGNIINSGGKFFSNYIPHCEVTAATKPTAGKILTGNNVSETSLVGQTDAFAPVTRSGANTLKVDVAGLSPYGTEAGHYGVVAVCSTASGYQKANLGQSALAANSKELVILKPNQNGTHPGVVSPSATKIPADTVECPTVISGDKATIKAYAPKETDPVFTAWKDSNEIVAGMAASANNGNYSVVIGSSANTQENSYGAVAIGKEAEALGAHATALGAYASAPDDGNDDSGNGIYTVGFPATEDHFYLNSSIHTAYEKKAYTLGSLLDKKAAKTDVVWTGVFTGEDSGYMKMAEGGDPMIVSGSTGSIHFQDGFNHMESWLFPDSSQVVTKNVLDAQGYATKSDRKMTVTNSNVNTSAPEYIVDMTQEDTIALTAEVNDTPEFKIKLPLPDPNTFSAASYTFSGIKRLIVSASKPCKIAGFVDADYDGTTDEKRLALLFEKDADGNLKDIRNETFESEYVLIEMFPIGAQWSANGHTWGIRWSRHGLAF